VSGSEIKRVPIPLFPLTFQRDIAALVDRAALRRIESLENYETAENLLLQGLGISEIDLSHELNYERNFNEVNASGRYDAEFFQPKYYRILETIRHSGYEYKPLGILIEQVRNGFDYREFTQEGTPYIRVGD